MTIVGAICMALVAATVLLVARNQLVTERTEKGDKVFFRARFAGLEKNQAEAACKYLKRSAIPCMLLKN